MKKPLLHELKRNLLPLVVFTAIAVVIAVVDLLLALGRLVEGGRQIVERPLGGLAGEHRGTHGGERDHSDQQPTESADDQEHPTGAQASEASGRAGFRSSHIRSHSRREKGRDGSG